MDTLKWTRLTTGRGNTMLATSIEGFGEVRIADFVHLSKREWNAFVVLPNGTLIHNFIIGTHKLEYAKDSVLRNLKKLGHI
jgi:hypothetical protein